MNGPHTLAGLRRIGEGWMIQRTQQEFRYLVELVEEGKRQGSISSDAVSGDIAWTMLLHAWGGDIARLVGVDEFIAERASERILQRALDSYEAARPGPGG